LRANQANQASGARWWWAAGAAAAFAAVGSASAQPLAAVPTSIASTTTSEDSAGAGCPEDTVFDNGACVHLADAIDDGPVAPSYANMHHEPSGRLSTYEQIPKLPERPADYDAYRYPIAPGLPGGHYVVSGYDLDRPDAAQRRGRSLRHVGHGGVDLPQTKGAPVRLVALEHQEGPAEVLYTGPLFGTTVVTRHTLREGGRLRDYVVLFGHLDSIAAGLSPGATLNDGDLVGAVGNTGSRELVHLHLEVRRVRDGVDLARVAAGGQLVAEVVSVVCDPRNVLPLREAGR